MWVNSVGNSQTRCPGHSAPFHLGKLRRIIVLSLTISRSSLGVGREACVRGNAGHKCRAPMVAPVWMVTSIPSPPHSVTGLPFLCESPSHAHSQPGSFQGRTPDSGWESPHTIYLTTRVASRMAHGPVRATGSRKTQFPPGF